VDTFLLKNDISIYHSLVNQYRPRSFSGKPSNRWANGFNGNFKVSRPWTNPRCSLLIIILRVCTFHLLQPKSPAVVQHELHVHVDTCCRFFQKTVPQMNGLSRVSYFTSPKTSPSDFIRFAEAMPASSHLDTWRLDVGCVSLIYHHIFHDLPWFTNDLPIILSYNILILPNLPSGNLT